MNREMPRQKKSKKVVPLEEVVALPPILPHTHTNASVVVAQPSNDWDSVLTHVKIASKWMHLTSVRRTFDNKLQKGSLSQDISSEQFYENLNSALTGISSECGDSGGEDDEVGKKSSSASYRNLPKSSNKALIIYFSRLAGSKNGADELDLDFISSLVDNGANINTTDKYGQTVFHEVARTWHINVGEFLLSLHANVNQCDRYGRTPLHIAAAVNYPDMVKFLIENGANPEVKTKNEGQTPVHYAAKNDALESLRMLSKLNCDMEAKDSKGRSPVHVAAELDRSETALFLVEEGVQTGNCDDSGLSTLTLMIDKMPPVALKALDQFHSTDRANRKQYFYLNMMEPIQPGKLGRFTRTPMQSVAIHNHMRLLLHPAFQRLIKVKWNYFARMAHWRELIIQLLFVFIWSAVGITTPMNGTNEYTKYYFKSVAHRAVLEALGVLLTLYFIFLELHEWRLSASEHSSWQKWRSTELHRDLKNCHPRWPEERKYIVQELEAVKGESIQYWKDFWNKIDWMTYFGILAGVGARICSLVGMSSAHNVYKRVLAISIIIIWVRLLKFMRPFTSLGPFIVMLGNILIATLKFSVLYFGLLIPYVIALWINFGGYEYAKIMKSKNESAAGWEAPHNLIYSTWLITVVGDFDFNALLAVDPIFAQVLVGSFTAISGIVLLNLYIALLSDTFQRVHDNVNANSLMQKVMAINSYQSNLSVTSRDKFLLYVQGLCAPEKVYYDDDDNEEEGELEKMTIQIKDIVDEIKEAVDTNVESGTTNNNTNNITTTNHNNISAVQQLKDEIKLAVTKHVEEMDTMRSKIDHLTHLIQRLVERSDAGVINRAGSVASTAETECSSRLDFLPSIYDLKPELFSTGGTTLEERLGSSAGRKKFQPSWSAQHK